MLGSKENTKKQKKEKDTRTKINERCRRVEESEGWGDTEKEEENQKRLVVVIVASDTLATHRCSCCSAIIKVN